MREFEKDKGFKYEYEEKEKHPDECCLCSHYRFCVTPYEVWNDTCGHTINSDEAQEKNIKHARSCVHYVRINDYEDYDGGIEAW